MSLVPYIFNVRLFVSCQCKGTENFSRSARKNFLRNNMRERTRAKITVHSYASDIEFVFYPSLHPMIAPIRVSRYARHFPPCDSVFLAFVCVIQAPISLRTAIL